MKVFNCISCGNNNWSIDYNEPDPYNQWVALFNKDFIIDMNLIDNTTAIFDLKKPQGHEFCTRLQYLANINPSNANLWLNRVLKLKVFY